MKQLISSASRQLSVGKSILTSLSWMWVEKILSGVRIAKFILINNLAQTLPRQDALLLQIAGMHIRPSMSCISLIFFFDHWSRCISISSWYNKLLIFAYEFTNPNIITVLCVLILFILFPISSNANFKNSVITVSSASFLCFSSILTILVGVHR